MRPGPFRSPRKPRLARYGALCGVAALLATFSLVGCSTPSGGPKGWTMPWSKPAEQKPVTYEQLAKDYKQRNIHSPALGLDQSIEPSPIKTAASSMGASMKEGADKVASAILPKSETAAPEAVASKPKIKWPFSKNDSVSADFYISLAQVYEQKEPEEAAAQYEKALSIDPKHHEAILAYAHLEDRTEKIEKAIGLYNRAMTLYPKDPRAYNDLGLCYARHDRYDDALACLNKAIKLKPDRELYRNNIATVLVKMGRTDEAVEQISLVYGEAVARYNVALMLNTQGDREAAKTQIVRALKVKPDLAQAQEWLTQLNSATEHEQMAEAGFVQGPVAMAGGPESGNFNRAPKLATPASAMFETARSPRATGATTAGLTNPSTVGHPASVVPGAIPPGPGAQPPTPRVTQMSAVEDVDEVDAEKEVEQAAGDQVESDETDDVTQAVMEATASDDE